MATLAGCVGYTTYPPPESGRSADAAINTLNAPPASDVVFAAVRYVTSRWPAAGPYAINLPADMDTKRARYVFDLLKDPDASPVTAESIEAGRPVYHVSRVWIRGAYAEVDVFRPIGDVPGPGGAPVHQLVTVTLKPNLMARWRVTGSRSSAIGLHAPPALAPRDARTLAAVGERP
ncbi:MAG: hypothetical protein D6693_07620 [Planctomycetota bacterium]|nr:MAG: hypothetical protein D6693_07620 [Planctomycetota bacterium]